MNLHIALSRAPGSPFLLTALSLAEFGQQVADALKTELHLDFIGETDLIVMRPAEVITRDPEALICSISLEHVRADIELDDHNYESTVNRLQALCADVISQYLRRDQTLDLVTSLYVDAPVLIGATGPSQTKFGGRAFPVYGLWDGQQGGPEGNLSPTFVAQALADMNRLQADVN